MITNSTHSVYNYNEHTPVFNWLLLLRTEFENKHLKSPDYLLIHSRDYHDLLHELSETNSKQQLSIKVIMTNSVQVKQPVYVTK